MSEVPLPNPDTSPSQLPSEHLTPETLALRTEETQRRFEKAKVHVADLEKKTESLAATLEDLKRQRNEQAIAAQLPDQQEAALEKMVELSTYIGTTTDELLAHNHQLVSAIETYEALAGELKNLATLADQADAELRRRGQA